MAISHRSKEEEKRFAELHCISNHSFLRGASHPEELVKQAALLGYQAIAITDECSFSGLVKAHIAAKKYSIKLIIGSEFWIEEGFKIILLAPDKEAYEQLSALISKLRCRSQKGSYHATLADFNSGLNRCLALWIPPINSFQLLISHGEKIKKNFLNLWIALELFYENNDLQKLSAVMQLSMELKIPVVASNNVHFHLPDRKPLQDVMTAIRLKKKIDELGQSKFQNAENYLRPINKLEAIYSNEMLEESLIISDKCTFSMDELRYEYPKDLVPTKLTASEYLKKLTLNGAVRRWPKKIPKKVGELIEKELKIINELEYEHYFLTVHDIVRFARNRKILCQGRGSAANSAVCYCLGITEVDPSRMNLLFERFISKERNEPPDIDVDFEHERREEVIQYIYQRYGRERASLAATLITYRLKSAIRDIGRAMGIEDHMINRLSKSLAWWDKESELNKLFTDIGLNPKSTRIERFLSLINQIIGSPRHLSQHVGGFIISEGPISQLVPQENAAMKNRTIIQWDKDDLESLGLLKIDILGLGMLTAIRKSIDYINNYYGTSLDISTIPAEDDQTYAMLQKGDSLGVFQVESRAQMAMLPRLKPKCFYDLVVEVAIVRPGPIQGDMVHPYLRRRQGLEDIEYPNSEVKNILERTLGIPIFQEQVIKLAMVAAGFSGGEADQLRRAMAAWKRKGGLENFRSKLINGMLRKGHDREFAERVFRQIQGFGEYGFPESHAASFALLVYVSAWLKCHEPAAFYCGLLNSLPMGFYSSSQIIQDAKRHGISVLNVDVQDSHWDHYLVQSKSKNTSQPDLRLGLRLIKGLKASEAYRIEKNQPFKTVEDLAKRASLNNQALRFLSRSGAMKLLSGNRYQSHWEVEGLHKPLSLEKGIVKSNIKKKSEFNLPAPSLAEDMIYDHKYLGLSLGPHPMKLLRKTKAFKNYCTAKELQNCRNAQFVKVAGIVTGRQRPGTANGILFLTIEDETGNINSVIKPDILARYRIPILQGQLLRLKGVIQREKEIIHFIPGYIEDVTYLLSQLSQNRSSNLFKPRNFH